VRSVPILAVMSLVFVPSSARLNTRSAFVVALNL
jgi:hypothetical protein